MHVMEDAHYLELTHPDTGAPVGHSETGDMICTCLFKDDIFPIIRFISHDVTEELAGASLRREYERVLRARLGVAVNVSFAQPGGLNELTGVERRQKPIRLIDKRKG